MPRRAVPTPSRVSRSSPSSLRPPQTSRRMRSSATRGGPSRRRGHARRTAPPGPSRSTISSTRAAATASCPPATSRIAGLTRRYRTWPTGAIGKGWRRTRRAPLRKGRPLRSPDGPERLVLGHSAARWHDVRWRRSAPGLVGCSQESAGVSFAGRALQALPGSGPRHFGQARPSRAHITDDQDRLGLVV